MPVLERGRVVGKIRLLSNLENDIKRYEVNGCNGPCEYNCQGDCQFHCQGACEFNCQDSCQHSSQQY